MNRIELTQRTLTRIESLGNGLAAFEAQRVSIEEKTNLLRAFLSALFGQIVEMSGGQPDGKWGFDGKALVLEEAAVALAGPPANQPAKQEVLTNGMAQ